jgi:hypothetical protein
MMQTAGFLPAATVATAETRAASSPQLGAAEAALQGWKKRARSRLQVKAGAEQARVAQVPGAQARVAQVPEVQVPEVQVPEAQARVVQVPVARVVARLNTRRPRTSCWMSAGRARSL